MKDNRPVFLSIIPLVFSFPAAALASIVHRITGVVLLGAVGFFLYLLDTALASRAGFDEAQSILSEPVGQLVLFASLVCVAYHLVLGIKHLLLDFHIADSLAGSRVATAISLGVFAILAVLSAVWVWS